MRRVNLRGLAAATALLGAAGLTWALVAPSSAVSGEKPVRVEGEFTLRFFPPGDACLPFPGPCLIGTATGDLSGDVFIRVYNSRRIEGSARTVSVSLADISITRTDGRLDGGAAGFLDVGTGEFRNVTPWVGGTGRYAGADGYVRVDGRDDLATGVERSRYKGFLFLPPE
jgi:hypothetical protein